MVDLARSGFGTALLPLAVIQRDLQQGALMLLDVDPRPIPLPLVASLRLEPVSPLAEVLVRMAQAACDQFVVNSQENVLAP